MSVVEEKWSKVIESEDQLIRFNFKELWHYRDLILLFVRRDFIAVYKQTILGPLWHLAQPIFTTIVYSFFGGLLNAGTDGLPRVLFVLSGVVMWSYFSSCMTKTASTFVGNAAIFGKVYFPRLVIPISVVISNLMSFGIQLLLLVPFLFYFRDSIHLNISVLCIPLIVLVVAMMSLGLGIIVSSLTIKYRDLMYLITFGVQLAMYLTPVIYPLSMVEKKYPGKLSTIFALNPITPMVELFRYALMGQGTFTPASIAYSCIFSLVILLIGIIMFNKVEKSFMDVV